MAAQFAWIFIRGVSTVFTTDVLSWSCFTGRRNAQDNYGGGRFAITIKNQANQAANYTRGTSVTVNLPNGVGYISGKINRVDFDDYPGNTGLSTATIVIDDPMAQAGRFYLENFTGYAQAVTTSQAIQTNTAYTGFNAPEVTAYGTGSSTATGVASYDGTMLNRLNDLQNTERGQIWANALGGVSFLARSQISAVNSITLTRNASSATAVAYKDIKRIQAGDNFMNYVVVTVAGLANQIGQNSTSISLYGRAGYNTVTADYNTTQAANNAQWLANSQSDPASERFEITFDTASNVNFDCVEDFLMDLIGFRTPTASLVYRVPGAVADTTTNVVIEGIQVSGTPQHSSFVLYASPSTFYQYFTLNSSVYGILNTSRLGW